VSTRFVATAPPAPRPGDTTTTPVAPAPLAPTPAAPDRVASEPRTGSGTAVLLPAARPHRAPTTFTLREATAAPSTEDADPGTTDAAADETRRPDGYVVFALGDACFAVPVDEVRAVVRTERVDLLPGGARPRYGRGVALVDVRGRAIPVVDLRSDPSVPGEVLLPLYRHQVGLVVDRVVSVSSSRELVPEPDGLPDVLPEYAQGVLRPVDGGPPVLLVELPDADQLQGWSADD
jgi:chemotaxis signal transduction protein